MTSRSLAAALLAAACAAAGCAKPSLKSFDVTPHVVCPRATATAAWDATADVVLYQESPIPPAALSCGTPPASAKKVALPQRAGTLPVQPEADTRFTLCFADATKPDSRLADVRVLNGDPQRLGSIPACGTNELRGTIAPTAPQAGAGLPVDVIANITARDLVVEHGGKSVPIAAGQRSDAFKGEPYAGEWAIRLPFKEGESCDQALDSISSRLRLELFFDCGGR